VFLVTIPITIFMNSFRIAVTGILVESGGAAHTEGFLHFFEGWVVFVVATLLLVAVAWVLIKFQPGSGNLLDALSLDGEGIRPAKAASSTSVADEGESGKGQAPLMATTAFVLLAAMGSSLLAGREEYLPERMSLDYFPAGIGEWTARVDRLPSIVEEVAGASEYFYGDFTLLPGKVVNAYVSYYETQRHGQIPHSPKVCIPGGGWAIESLDPVLIKVRSGKSFEANRLVTSNGGQKVVSYYWLKQGSKEYRNEFLARLDLIRFALMENRTDGALIRLVTEVKPNEDLMAADERLGLFAAEFAVLLPRFVPD